MKERNLIELGKAATTKSLAMTPGREEHTDTDVQFYRNWNGDRV